MGYSSSAEGCIGISPPLTAKEMREHPDIAYSERKAMDTGKDAYVEVSKHTTETDDGAVIVLTGLRIRPPGDDESFKRYYLEDHIKEIVEAFPNHKFDGVIECKGEDGEMWAYKVKDGKVITLRAEITWVEE